MGNLKVALLLVSLAMAGEALAQSCAGGTQVTNTVSTNVLGTLLSGKTVCASLGNERWQEFHAAGGALVDIKLGPTSKTDASEQVGTWLVSGTDAQTMVTYNYGSGGTFSYTVHQTGGKYNFCGVRTISGATLLAGQTACP